MTDNYLLDRCDAMRVFLLSSNDLDIFESSGPNLSVYGKNGVSYRYKDICEWVYKNK